MNKMNLRNFIKKNLAFLIPISMFLISGIVLLLSYHKDQLHLIQNSWHDKDLDYFFTYITFLGSGFVFLPIGFLLIFTRWRYFLGLVIASILTLLITTFLKHVVFEEKPRPVKYFETTKQQLHLVEGVKVEHWNSFPSGHATAVFVCFGFLAFLIKGNILKVFAFILAALAGYSRVYLSQHFLEDVIAGAFIGTCIAGISHWLMLYFKYSWVDDKFALSKK